MRSTCREPLTVDGQTLPCGRPKSKRSTKWCSWHWLLQQTPSVRDQNAVRRRDELKQDPQAVLAGDRQCVTCSWFVPPFFFGRGRRCVGCEGKAAHESHVVNTYDLQRGDWDALFALQLGKCAICRQTQRFQRLSTDHDHPSDAVRGLLCLHCNESVLGSIGGDTEKALPIARSLVYFLEHHPSTGRWTPPEHVPEFGFPQPVRDERTLDDLILGDPSDTAGMALAPF